MLFGGQLLDGLCACHWQLEKASTGEKILTTYVFLCLSSRLHVSASGQACVIHVLEELKELCGPVVRFNSYLSSEWFWRANYRRFVNFNVLLSLLKQLAKMARFFFLHDSISSFCIFCVYKLLVCSLLLVCGQYLWEGKSQTESERAIKPITATIWNKQLFSFFLSKCLACLMFYRGSNRIEDFTEGNNTDQFYECAVCCSGYMIF